MDGNTKCQYKDLSYSKLSSPWKLEKTWSMKFSLNKKFYVKKLCLRTYCKLDLLNFLFFYLNAIP